MNQNPEEIALIRSIVANPDEDTPRLVYADWLDEHGRGDRARLIRVQCSIENLQSEERALIRKHGREWGETLFACGADDWKFHRGFPEEVTMGYTDYFDEHERLNDLTPLRRLHFLEGAMDDAALRRLAALPAARQIQLLEIGQAHRHGYGRFGVEGIRALAESPHLGGLRSLRLHSDQIGNAGVDVIADAPTFANLADLALTDPALSANAEAIGRLVGSPHLSRLTDLQCGDTPFGEYALGLMRSSGPGPSGGRGRP